MTTNQIDSYFAGEAGDYLAQLEELLEQSELPDTERLLKLAIGVRGSTRMAGAEAVARLAGRLENAARSLAEDRLGWDIRLRDLARGTVEEIRELVGRLDRWGPAEEDRARRAAERWNGLGHSGDLDSRPVVPIDTLFFDDAGPHVLVEPERLDAQETVAVPIGRLLLRGRAAFDEAIRLRPAIEAAVRDSGASSSRVAELIDELFDLLELATTHDTTEE